MNKKKTLAMALSCALVAVVGIGSTFAYFTDKEEATNKVTMGHIDVDLSENCPEGTPTEVGFDFSDVVPGDTIEKDVDITLSKTSQDCYIRAEILIAWDNKELEVALNDNMLNIGENWKKGDDGKYYYQEKLSNKDVKKVDLFDTVTIPTAWGNNTADEKFSISIKVEAIQADNLFAVEPNEITSWGDNITTDDYDGEFVPQDEPETTPV